MDKKQSRLRRARQTRIRIAEKGVHRLVVHRSNQHIYAQIYSVCGQQVIASASTLDATVKGLLKGATGADIEAAKIVGSEIAKRADVVGVKQVAFDRSGFRYHGRIQALADAARAAGLAF